MQITNKYYYFKNSICLTSNSIREIDRLIKIYYDFEPTISSKLGVDTSVSFDSIDELLNYENYKKEKLTSIRFNYGHRCYLEFETTIFGNVSLNCEEIDIDDYNVLIGKIEKELNKIRIFTMPFSKIQSFFGFCASIYTAYVVFQRFIGNIIPYDVVFYFCYIYMFYNLLSGILFPKLIFYWGEEIKRFSRLKDLRNFIMISIILLGIILPFLNDIYIFDILKKLLSIKPFN